MGSSNGLGSGKVPFAIPGSARTVAGLPACVSACAYSGIPSGLRGRSLEVYTCTPAAVLRATQYRGLQYPVAHARPTGWNYPCKHPRWSTPPRESRAPMTGVCLCVDLRHRRSHFQRPIPSNPTAKSNVRTSCCRMRHGAAGGASTHTRSPVETRKPCAQQVQILWWRDAHRGGD